MERRAIGQDGWVDEQICILLEMALLHWTSGLKQQMEKRMVGIIDGRRTTQPPVEFRYTRKDLNDRKRHLKFNEAGKRVQNSMEIGM